MSQYSRYPSITGGGGGGTVTSVGLSAPSVFVVVGSPVTGSGTLTLALAAEPANTVFAGPTSGGPATPTFRALVAADMPAGVGTVTSVALTTPGVLYTVSGSPITTSGTLALNLISQSQNFVLAGPTSGSGNPSFRLLVAGDIPTISLTTGVSGILPIANGGTNASTASSAFNNLSPVTSTGDLIIGTGVNTASRLGIGTAGQVLTVSGGTTIWATPTTGTVTSVTASAPLSSSGGATPNITIAQSTTSTDGYLSSIDWNTFNSKQPAGSYITALTGDGTASGPGSAAFTLTTVNSNIGSFGTASSVGTFTVNAKGLITAASDTPIQITEAQVTNLTTDLAAKLTNPMTTTGDTIYSNPGVTPVRLPIGSAGQVLTVSGGLPIWASPATSGTVTSVSVVSANGFAGTVATATTTPAITLTTTITGILQGNGTAISAASTTGTGAVVLATSPTLVTPNLGTPSAIVLTNGTGLPLTTGVTGVLPIANGGTNASTASSAFNNLSPITSVGDLIIGTGVNTASRLGIGTAAQVLTVSGGTAVWATPSTGGTVTSVALTVPSFLTVSGSPITTSGTLAVDLATETANTVFAGPASGGAAQPTFRALVNADLPVNPVFSSITDSSLTPGSVIFAGTGGLLSQDNANFFWDDTNNRLGIATNAPLYPLHVLKTWTDTSGTLNNGSFNLLFAPTSASSATARALDAIASFTDDGTTAGTGSVVGGRFLAVNSRQTGALTTMQGLALQAITGPIITSAAGTATTTTTQAAIFQAVNNSNTTATLAEITGGIFTTEQRGTAASTTTLQQAGLFNVLVAGGTTTDLYGARIRTSNIFGSTLTGGTITNTKLLDLEGYPTGPTYTNTPEQIRLEAGSTAAIAIRQQGASNTNRFQGNTRFGADTAPTTAVDVTGNVLVSGTITATPLTAGSVIFAGTAGVLSQDNANLFFDDTNNRLGIGTAAPGATLDVATKFTVDSTGIVKKYNNVATVSNGVPASYATIDLTTQGAAIAATTAYTTTAAGLGMYRVSWVATVTRAGSTSSRIGGTNGFQITYTDGDDSVVKTVSTDISGGITSNDNTTATSISGVWVAYCKASTNIQYSMDYTSGGLTTMQYNLHIKVEAL